MSAMPCRLEAQWKQLTDTTGQLEFTLFNFSDVSLKDFKLAYTSLTRNRDASQIGNATLLHSCANFHELTPPEGFTLEPGGSWHFTVGGLNRVASHRTDGVSTAYITLADGTAYDIESGDLLRADMTPDAPNELVPEGKPEEPVGIIPWPKSCELSDYAAPPPILAAAEGTGAMEQAAMAEVSALGKRLFPNSLTPFALVSAADARPVRFERPDGLTEEGYTLEFGPESVRLCHGGARGLFYGLVTLAQMLHAAHSDPNTYRFPRGGSIVDAPRYDWRGCHLDVSRQVYPIESVTRFIDILAWNKMNVLHWHLTDDEGWRLEIKAYPELTDIGAKRGPNEKMVPQLGSGAETSVGFYTQEQVRDLIAHAKRLNVEIMPEFDIPGHCTAVLKALPHLVDPDETPESYRSVQGYPNNALNPALAETYTFLETVFGEVAALFPFEYIHLGGDEVADSSWLSSPRAQDLMKQEGLAGTPDLQTFMLNKCKAIVTGLGKKMGGWDEMSHGAGVESEGVLLMAWQRPELGIELAKRGYDVVMTPGQAYYLDMVQDDAWLEPGTSWAGTVPPEWTYEYEATGNFPPEFAGQIKGVQGCIWSENLTSRDRFNHMVFPRLGAVAEAGWTPAERKNWQRFAALSRLMPRL